MSDKSVSDRAREIKTICVVYGISEPSRKSAFIYDLNKLIEPLLKQIEEFEKWKKGKIGVEEYYELKEKFKELQYKNRALVEALETIKNVLTEKWGPNKGVENAIYTCEKALKSQENK